ncbi:glutathione transferase GstA [Xanthomonas campestris pv. phormiicola]|nr:glutathione transferase GstA [Xanthomonas campestris pv. phormiicola]UYC16038.1 glutathione transferase GstA [Xanthomonas campestris pv. phormiicola]
MKLYYIPAACSLAPHIVLHELGLEAKLVRVDHRKHLTEDGADFHRVNTMGYVPALELDDGSVLREGTVIVQYLGDLKPERGLVPPNGSMQRYRLQEWLNFLATEIHKGFIPLLYARLAGQYVDTARPKLEQRFAWIDAQLAGRRFLMGDAFTVADASLYALTGWGQASWLTSHYKADIHFDALQNLQAWYQRVHARPSVQQALSEEGLQ